ncbi:MAG: hypothetical protein K1X67_20890 [Fimbriimonadaceae bacterium]|nr:hypothetical protein [Fimbriimonadaceae bacterium]
MSEESDDRYHELDEALAECMSVLERPKWDQDRAKHALDDLFYATLQYRSSTAFHDLLRFVARFRTYSPYNAMLLHVQRPGASYVAPASRWRDRYCRTIKPNANPLVILQPMGPVMFVFDVSDTDAGPHAVPLPPEITRPL